MDNQVKLDSGLQYAVTPIPAHVHNGTDSLPIDPSNFSGLATMPTGVVVPFAGSSSSVPTGWILCDGRAISRTTYSALFSTIGTEFGTGNGTTTFNVPSTLGRTVAGAGNGTGGGTSGNGPISGGSSLTARTLGDWFGEETHTLTTGEMPAHVHGSVMVNLPGNILATSGSGVAESTGDTASTGGGGAHQNMQPSICFWYIIKS